MHAPDREHETQNYFVQRKIVNEPLVFYLISYLKECAFSNDVITLLFCSMKLVSTWLFLHRMVKHSRVLGTSLTCCTFKKN